MGESDTAVVRRLEASDESDGDTVLAVAIHPEFPQVVTRPCFFEDENHCQLCKLWFTNEEYRTAWERLPPYRGTETKSPTFIQKVKSFKTAYETWVEAGKPITPDDEFAKRRVLCDGCEHKTANDECGKCGCPLEKPGWMVRLLTDSPGKLRMASETCPAGKWGAVSTEA